MGDEIAMADKETGTQGQPSLSDEIFPLPPEREELATDWHDPDHTRLVVTLLDSDGSQLAQAELPAPLNKNAAAPCLLVLGVEHEDGCWKPIDRIAIPPY